MLESDVHMRRQLPAERTETLAADYARRGVTAERSRGIGDGSWLIRVNGLFARFRRHGAERTPALHS